MSRVSNLGRYISLLLLGLLTTHFTMAQSVSGLIADDSGETLIGATVSIKGTTKGTIADLDGQYTIAAAANDTLVISFVGYERMEIPVNGRASIDVTMSPDNQTLGEVVVTGFGTQQRRYITSSIAKVDAEELENLPNSTVDGALQGRAAGVQVIQSDGMAGSPVTIRVRGTSSVNASSEPLYVVDGVPIITGNFTVNNANDFSLATAHESNALVQINPADIASIEILKDASATAIYGSRGANGVVLITTKKGSRGKTKFDIGYRTGISNETRRIDMMDGPQYIRLAQEAWTNTHNREQQDDDPSNDDDHPINDNYDRFWLFMLPPGLTREQALNTNTDWIDQTLRTGTQHEVNLSASGGNEKTTFYIGGSFRDEKGILVNDDFRRLNTRINLDHNVNKRLSLGANSAFTLTDHDKVPVAWAGGLGAAQSQALPYFPIYNEDGSYFQPQSGDNVVAELENTNFNTKAVSFLGNVYAQYYILPNLTIRADAGLNSIYADEKFYRSEVIEPIAIATHVISQNPSWNVSNLIQYDLTMGEHVLQLSGGTNFNYASYRANIINGEGFSNPSQTNPENAAVQTASIAASEYSFASFFGRVNYRFMDKLLLTTSIRRDGSSRFGPDNRWGNFPAASVGYIVTEDLKSKKLTYLKLRAGYGITGNSEIGNYEYFGSYETTNYVDNSGVTLDVYDNPLLGWERTAQYDLGVDWGILESRIEGGIDFYQKITTDLLQTTDLSALTGATSISRNIGRLRNRGVELFISSHNFNGQKFRWTTDFNISYNENRLLELGEGVSVSTGVFGEGSSVAEGQPLGVRWLVPWAGIAESDMTLEVTNPNTGAPQTIEVLGGDELFINQFGELTNIYSQEDFVHMGNPLPKWTGGLTNSFSYGQFDFSFLLVFALGHDIENAEQRYQYHPFGRGWTSWSDIDNAWREDGDQTEFAQVLWFPPNREYVSSRYLYDASFVRLRDLTISYTLGSSTLEKLRLDNARIFLKGTNLHVFTSYPGWDPEYNRDGAGNVEQSKSWLPSPQARTISFGLNVTL